MMGQAEFTGIFTSRPQNFAWFLGAGTSRSAGLPTATDIIWDLKRRHYCREENQDISRQDIQSDAVRARIQAFMDSHGFPALWADDEYTGYFEKIFGEDKERQRRYIKAMLAEDKVSLTVGNRVLAALMTSGMCRAVFTTNFDTIVEKAVAEVAGQSLSAFHIEGSGAANNALNNEEFPIYCKLHGDFRYDSIKNLSSDLETQNRELSACLVNGANRFGFVVAGYSGRDESVMALFRKALESQNPFPHGLYWTGIKGASVHPAVTALIEQAQEKSITSAYVEIETFDTLMLRLWRNIDRKSPDLDAQVKKTHLTEVTIPLPAQGRQKPLMRLNALPVLGSPDQCLSLSFDRPMEWDELRTVARESHGTLVLTKSDSVWCWGTKESAQEGFGKRLRDVSTRPVPTDFRQPDSLHVKGFMEEALAFALIRDRPLLARMRHGHGVLIVDPHAEDVGALEPLFQIVGKTSGNVPGLFTDPTPEHPKAEQVRWAESLRVSLDQKGGRLWLLIDPDIWIWPPRARDSARDFLDGRRKDRRNDKYNAILDAWVQIIMGTDERNAEIVVRPFANGSDSENPTFRIASRTAFSRRLAS